MDDINRFVKAQEQYNTYQTALKEIKNGRKYTHWIWFIFPQLRGLGRSSTSEFYGIASLEEAKAYLADETLNARLREITTALLAHNGKTAIEILGGIDALKVKSSMTLFDLISPNDIYAEVLQKFYNGERCTSTLKLTAQNLNKI
ncbi:MAG: DUF1810 domain-containing protein [Paludibacteraceae bacterium]|nr:DUF1810 domain-containing protein [Paludibacteraceae bacterium]